MSGAIYSLSPNGHVAAFAVGFSNPGDLAVGVPEPDSIAMLLIGSGALLFGYARRTGRPKMPARISLYSPSKVFDSVTSARLCVRCERK